LNHRHRCMAGLGKKEALIHICIVSDPQVNRLRENKIRFSGEMEVLSGVGFTEGNVIITMIGLPSKIFLICVS
jgi:hypothetical protein